MPTTTTARPEADELQSLRAWLASDPPAKLHAIDVRWAVAEIERLNIALGCATDTARMYRAIALASDDMQPTRG